MNKLSRHVPIAAAWLALACGGASASMTKAEYKAAKAPIAAEYQAERQKCGVRHGNSLDLCVARAHGVRDVAKAELEAAYRPSVATHYAAAIARAKSAYAIAREECDQKEGGLREKCIGDAKASLATATAGAKAVAAKAL